MPEEDKRDPPRAAPGSRHLPWDRFSIPSKAAVSARGRRLGRRTCLRKGCGRRFQARRQNQRYCQDPECRKELRRWQAAKRQQKRRAEAEGRRQHAEAERQRRKRKADEAKAAEKGPAVAAAAGTAARGHAAEKHPAVFCDRPGCYEAVRESPGAPASYCGDACRTAMNRAEDRQRKWLLRKRPAGRIKRQLEYQAARAKRRGGDALADAVAPPSCFIPLRQLSPAVVNSRSVNAGLVGCKDSQETGHHGSQTDSRYRPRAPPADTGLVVDWTMVGGVTSTGAGELLVNQPVISGRTHIRSGDVSRRPMGVCASPDVSPRRGREV